jgi:hypothetical protein
MPGRRAGRGREPQAALPRRALFGPFPTTDAGPCLSSQAPGARDAGGRRGRPPRRPTRLLFRAADYGTVRVPPVANDPFIELEIRDPAG